MDPPTEDELKAQEAAAAAVKQEPEVKAQDEPPLDDEAPAMPSAAPPLPPQAAPAAAPATSSPEPEAKRPVPSGPGTNTCELPTEPQPAAERSAQFLELRSYEAKRRTIYTSKHKSTSLYWRAFRSLLVKAYQETDRAESLLQGSFVANRAYASYLQAAADDRLDANGKPVDERRGKRLQSEKQKKYSSLGGGSLLLGMSMEMDRRSQEKEREKVKRKADYAAVNSSNFTEASANVTNAILDATSNSNAVSGSGSGSEEAGIGIGPSISFEGLASDSMITTLISSHHDTAEMYTEHVNHMENIILPKIKDLKKELEAEVSVMSALGDATLFELERAEEDVQKAWAAYYSLASLIDTDNKEIVDRRNKKAEVKGMDPNAVTDVWLVEMHYRMAVAYLTTVWEKSSKELSDLFAGVKEMEGNRRFRLREILVLHSQRNAKLFGAIPDMLQPVIESLNEVPSDTKVVEEKITEKIREKAKALKERDEAEEVGSFATDPLNGPGLMGVPEPDPNFELQSPLMSNLLTKVQVIWRKSDKIMAVWKPCMAVTTSDCYLHLFEIPAEANVQTGTAPEVAFQTMVPSVTVPTEESIIEGSLPSRSGVAWFEHLIPGTSFDLKNSNIAFNQQKGNSTFEITETLAGTGVSKLMNKNTVRRRKFSLRMYSSQHMVDWLLALRALGAD